MTDNDYSAPILDTALRNARSGWTLLPGEATALYKEIERLRRVVDAAILYINTSPYDDLPERLDALDAAVATYQAGE